MTSHPARAAGAAPPPAAPEALSDDELVALVGTVFRPTADDRRLAFLVDLPDDEVADDEDWGARRRLAADWARRLAGRAPDLGLATDLVLFPNARQNNADLPDRAWVVRDLPDGGEVAASELPADVAAAEVAGDRLEALGMDDVLARYDLLVAPTRFSATAPLKVAARERGFRAATMPRFQPSMLPALRLDFEEVDRRVRHLKTLLDRATGADLTFRAGGATHRLHLDLRHRSAHASGGLVRERGTAGNLPSGETYIVPYEGERQGDPSRSAGLLPVELDGELVLYRIAGNRARGVESDGPISRREAAAIAGEPAYSNLAELGLGVLADLGIEPVGEILLDEKLGLHIAFGRSEHFGGQVGPADFSAPSAVVHIDRVYLPETQPQVVVESVILRFPDDEDLVLMREGRYAIDFAAASA